MTVEAQLRSWRHIAALSLIVLALGVAALVAIAPFYRAASIRMEIAAARNLLAQQERHQRDVAGRSGQGSREFLLAGESSGLAGAELQRLVAELARQSGLTLRSTQIVPAKRESDLTVITVDVILQGGMEGLRALLHSIETGVPILFTEALSIRSVPARQVEYQPVSLDITLKVRGYGTGKKDN
jgi:general secretion pathway protein M